MPFHISCTPASQNPATRALIISGVWSCLTACMQHRPVESGAFNKRSNCLHSDSYSNSNPSAPALLLAGSRPWHCLCPWHQPSAARPACPTGSTRWTPAQTSTSALGMECATWAHVTAWTGMEGQIAAARYSHATVPLAANACQDDAVNVKHHAVMAPSSSSNTCQERCSECRATCSVQLDHES